MVTIRPARQEDLDLLWPLVCRAVAQMNAQGNPQWGDDYPTRAHYEGDLARGELFVASTLEGRLAGVACINTAEPPAYAPLPWAVHGAAVVLHRMAVDPCLQRSGVGRAFFAYGEALGRKNGIPALRVDTYSRNTRMQGLLRSCGFHRVGLVQFDPAARPLGYPCFEKALD